MRPDVGYHFSHARKKQGIVQDRLTHVDAISTELSSIAHQPTGVGQGSYRNGSVVSRHPTELLAGHNRRSRAQISGSDSGQHTCRSSANDDNVSQGLSAEMRRCVGKRDFRSGSISEFFNTICAKR
jgi:hypothetical protein